MEASLCQYLTAAKEDHVHGVPEELSFSVTIAPKRHALYVPSIVLTQTRNQSRVIIVEPVDSIRPGGGVRRLQGFRKAHLTDYFLVVVARRALHPHIPDDAYDLLVPLEDFLPLDDFLTAL
jgi:hypothetical protein